MINKYQKLGKIIPTTTFYFKPLPIHHVSMKALVNVKSNVKSYMNPEEVKLNDFQRILFGEAPEIFLIETLIRTLLMYLFLLLIIRWLGKRMSGQLSINEMAVMLVLGAIVSVPMQLPGSGLAQGVLLLVCTLTFQRGMSWFGYKSSTFEKLYMGEPIILVRDGVFELAELRRNKITRQMIFSQLRQNGVMSLGCVERLYMETSGIFSIYCFHHAKPGLSVFPPTDHLLWTDQNKHENLMACKNCGYVEEVEAGHKCSNCTHDEWIEAVIIAK